MYRFLFRPKWLLFFAGCVALAVVFVNLGLWQLDRLDQRHAQNDRVTAARHAEPTPVADALSTDRAPAKQQLFRRIEATGRYDAEREYLVRGRTVGDRAGLLVLTPLVTTDGKTLLVVRGWVAASSRGAHVAPEVPAPQSGEVTVVGRVRAPESGATAETRVGRFRTVKQVNVATLAGELDQPVYQGYVELIEAPDGLVAIPDRRSRRVRTWRTRCSGSCSPGSCSSVTGSTRGARSSSTRFRWTNNPPAEAEPDTDPAHHTELHEGPGLGSDARPSVDKPVRAVLSSVRLGRFPINWDSFPALRTPRPHVPVSVVATGGRRHRRRGRSGPHACSAPADRLPWAAAPCSGDE